MKFLFALLIMCSFSLVSSAQTDGDGCGPLLNYESGFRIGQSLCDDYSQGNYENNSLVKATFEKYRSICREYAQAVIDGWASCSSGRTPVGGLSGGVSDNPCKWNGYKWVCE